MLRKVPRKRVFREMQVCRTPAQVRIAEEKAKYPSHDAGSRPTQRQPKTRTVVSQV